MNDSTPIKDIDLNIRQSQSWTSPKEKHSSDRVSIIYII